MDDTETLMKQLAHNLIEEFGTADCSEDELIAILLENDIPEEIAEEVVADVRG